jgi:hypothetical protein
MEKNQSKSIKCECCEQKFSENQLTKEFNRIYNYVCTKCSDYINNRGDITGNCSNYCKESGKCDGTC